MSREYRKSVDLITVPEEECGAISSHCIGPLTVARDRVKEGSKGRNYIGDAIVRIVPEIIVAKSRKDR